MIQSKKQSSPFCSLLDLPDEMVQAIISWLAAADKISFMASCKKACHLTSCTAEISVKITKDTKFAGIKQALDLVQEQIQLHILCTAVHKKKPKRGIPASALNVFMGMAPGKALANIATSCRWDCVKKVIIQGTKMKCLLPHFLAVACPKLVQLKIVKPRCEELDKELVFNVQPRQAVPLTLCSSLTHLEFSTKKWNPHNLQYCPFQLPALHHTPEELQRNLPNIDTLIMTHPNVALIQAFGNQLTRLEITHDIGAEHEQAIQQCSNLQHLRTKHLALPDNTSALTFLSLSICGSDDDFKKLLQLTSLKSLHIRAFGNKEDWTHHALPWQELHLEHYIWFTALSLINLRSLKKLSLGPDLEIAMPDWKDPGALEAVKRAVDNLAHVGKLLPTQRTADTRAYFGECGTLSFGETDDTAAAAELIRVAAQRIGHFKVVDIELVVIMSNNSLILDEIVSWGKTFIESVCLGFQYQVEAYVWKALQQLNMLETIVYWSPSDGGDEEDEEHPEERQPITTLVRNAAEQYVIPTSKSLRMEFGVRYDTEEEEAFANNRRSVLQTAIQGALPAGSKLESIEYHSMQGNHLYTNYGGECGANAFWVVFVAPDTAKPVA